VAIGRNDRRADLANCGKVFLHQGKITGGFTRKLISTAERTIINFKMYVK
jgi:hypothetical protein